MSAFVPLKRLAQVRYGLGQPPQIAEHGVAIIRATNIFRGRIVIKDLIRARLEDLPLDRAPLLKLGEVLVVRSGAYTGDSALVTPDWVGSAPGYDLRITPGRDLEPRFIAFTMLGRRAMDEIDLAKSRAAQSHLNAEDLGQVGVLDAPISKQRSIANYLDQEITRIDTLIVAKQRMAELLEERFWSWVDSEIIRCADSWLPLRRFISQITDGPFGSSLTSSDYSESGARVVRLGNIGRWKFRDDDAAFIDHEYFRSLLRHRVRPGDLLIAGLGDVNNHVGRACVAPDLGDAIVKADCYCALVNSSVATADFLALYLSSSLGAKNVAVAARGTTRSRINLEIARDIITPVISVGLQRQIAESAAIRNRHVLETATRLRSQLDLLVEHRQALITAAVTGQLDISGAA